MLTPVAVPLGAFLGGVLTYVSGTATIQGFGLPGVEYWNLERRSRATSENSGCVVHGHELFTYLPNNAAVVLMGRVFGPMPGAYRGPYPSRAEARQFIETGAEPIDVAELAAGRLRLEGRVVPLGPGLLGALERRPVYLGRTGLPAAVSGKAQGNLAFLRVGDAADGLLLLLDFEGQHMVATYDLRRRP